MVWIKGYHKRKRNWKAPQERSFITILAVSWEGEFVSDLDRLVYTVREKKRAEDFDREIMYQIWNTARAKERGWKLTPRQKNFWLLNYHKAKENGWLEHWSHMFPEWDSE